jgi:hypothetical protein
MENGVGGVLQYVAEGVAAHLPPERERLSIRADPNV